MFSLLSKSVGWADVTVSNGVKKSDELAEVKITVVNYCLVLKTSVTVMVELKRLSVAIGRSCFERTPWGESAGIIPARRS
jgi:hypothetical protein